MFVWKPVGDGKFIGQPLQVVERERLMGFPEGYVMDAGKKLEWFTLDTG